MAEYWKSYAKKYCEICKIWFADNKVSIENHERGLKHKAMVQQRLRESTRKAKEKERQASELQHTLLCMEQAALASMRKDGQMEFGPEVAPSASYARLDAWASDSGGHGSRPGTSNTYDKEYIREVFQKAKEEQREIEDARHKEFLQQAVLANGLPMPKGLKREYPESEQQPSQLNQFTPYVPPPPPPSKQVKRQKDLDEDEKKPILVSSMSRHNAKEVSVEKKIRASAASAANPLGQWVPVEKKPKSEHATFNDLPQQSERKTSEIVEEMQLGAEELTFADKVLPVSGSGGSKKKSKPVEFKKRSAKASLRTRTD